MPTAIALEFLRSPASIRSQCQQLFKLACEDRLKHFAYEPARLPEAVAYVLSEMHSNYGRGPIPFHSRFRHFEVGGKDRLGCKLQEWQAQSAEDRGRRLFELVFISVLLDAGAGPAWSYTEADNGGIKLTRSEGLAVASLEMFCGGLFSSSATDPERVDAAALQALRQEDLARGFQITAANPLVGLTGRLQLLQGLGKVLQENAGLSARAANAPVRLGSTFDLLYQQAQGQGLKLARIFSCLLDQFSSIWPGGTLWQGINIGDVGRHSQVQGPNGCAGLVPFHKLTQWLSYSLLESFALSGCPVTGLDELTGLPEYRNGGLFLDLGVLQAKDPSFYTTTHSPHSEAIVELRALTVSLLERLAEELRRRLEKNADELPLVAILQGGTWSAGRKIAKSKRADGSPPFSLASDGTVF